MRGDDVTPERIAELTEKWALAESLLELEKRWRIRFEKEAGEQRRRAESAEVKWRRAGEDLLDSGIVWVRRLNDMEERAEAAERLCVALVDGANAVRCYSSTPVVWDNMPDDWQEQVEIMRRRRGGGGT